MKKLYIIIICMILICNLEGCIYHESKSKNNIDINDYMKKIWVLDVADSKIKEKKMHNVFIVLEETEENIRGAIYMSIDLLNDDIVINEERKVATFTGKLFDNTLQCSLINNNKILGTINLNFTKNDRIEVIISDLKNAEEATINTGKYQFKSYKLENIKNGKKSKEIEKDIQLEHWGEVHFVSWVYTTLKKHRSVVMYLVDDQKNVLYKFNKKYGFPEGYFVKEISFQDMNNDNNEDLILILEDMATSDEKGGDKSYVALVFWQSDVGIFEWDESIDNQLNSYNGKTYNDCVKRVTDYLDLVH